MATTRDALDLTTALGTTTGDVEPFDIGTISELLNTDGRGQDPQFQAMVRQLAQTLRQRRQDLASTSNNTTTIDDIEAFDIGTISELLNTDGHSDEPQFQALMRQLAQTRRVPAQPRPTTGANEPSPAPLQSLALPPSAGPNDASAESSGHVSPFEGTLSEHAALAATADGGMNDLIKALSSSLLTNSTSTAAPPLP